jgi:hypothetical protein
MSHLHRVLFYAGCGSLAMIAAIHLISHFLAPLDSQNEDQEKLLSLYRSIKFQMPLGQERTLSEIMNGYSLYFPTLLLAVVLCLLISRHNLSMLKQTLQITLVMLFTLILLTHIYMVTPPLIMMCFSMVCFSITLLGMVKKTNP